MGGRVGALYGDREAACLMQTRIKVGVKKERKAQVQSAGFEGCES